MPVPASRCSCCGNRSVRPRVGAGRFRPYRMFPALAIPADFAIPTCSSCCAEYIDGSAAELLSQVMKAAFEDELRDRARETIASLCRYVSQRQLEKLLGLAQGYLSRLHAGSGTPSAPLIALLTFLAKDPLTRLQELEMNWADRPFPR